MNRVVSVWLPDWPVTAFRRAEPAAAPPEGQPFALIGREGQRQVLTALNPAARALGLRMGQAHADARAMVPDLIGLPARPDQDRDALRRLALWAERYAPTVATCALFPGQEGLFLDMTGGAHLFGGEAALLAEMRARLAAAGVPARVAMADTLGAAWALARFAPGPEAIAPPGATREALADLPVAALRLQPAAVTLLGRFGLRRIGDLYALPRAGLARRFRGEAGLAVVERLDQALGAAGEAVDPVRPPPVYRAWMVFAEPLLDTAGVDHRLDDLARELARQLDRDGQGARRLTLTAFRVDGRAVGLSAGLSAPAARPAHLTRLLREKGLEHLDLGFGADALMLSADRAEPLAARQGEMTGERAVVAADALAALIDRLQAKLGEDAVRQPVLAESWTPERSERWIRASPEAAAVSVADDDPARPLMLFDPPEPVQTMAELPDGLPAQFVWRRVARKVARAEGPERLSAEWWRPAARPERAPRTRDYYRVEDQDGRRYWLFREGLYGREDAPPAEGEPPREPTWWLHGVFA